MELVQAYLELYQTRPRHRPPVYAIGNASPRSFSRMNERVVMTREEASQWVTTERRPLPRDMNVPLGFKREGAYITVDNSEEDNPFIPERPRPPEPRYEIEGFGFSEPGESLEVFRARTKHTTSRLWFLFSAILLIIVNVGVAIFDPPYPIGFIPLPILIFAYWNAQKKSDRYYKIVREREERTVDELLNGRGRGTTTITR